MLHGALRRKFSNPSGNTRSAQHTLPPLPGAHATARRRYASSQIILRSRGLPLSRRAKGCPPFGSTGRRLHVCCSEAPFRRTTESEHARAVRRVSRWNIADVHGLSTGDGMRRAVGTSARGRPHVSAHAVVDVVGIIGAQQVELVYDAAAAARR